MTLEADKSSNPELDNQSHIRQASEQDFDSVWGIISTCSDWLVEKGHDNWARYYSRDLIAKKLQNQEVYLLSSVDGRVVGTVTLDDKPVDYYTTEDIAAFDEPEAAALYVTALGVIPAEQGKGYASWMMEFVEDKARERGLKYIRFDCRARYMEAVRFYEHRGFRVKGLLWDEEDNNETYCLMEKRLERMKAIDNPYPYVEIDYLREEDISEMRPILEQHVRDRNMPDYTNNREAILWDEIEEIQNYMKGELDDEGRKRTFLVAKDIKGRVLGCMALAEPDKDMLAHFNTTIHESSELLNAFVDSKHFRGKRVGLRLLERIYSLAREWGKQQVIIHSGPRYKASWGFYDKLTDESCGYISEKYGPGGDAKTWRKIL